MELLILLLMTVFGCVTSKEIEYRFADTFTENYVVILQDRHREKRQATESPLPTTTPHVQTTRNLSYVSQATASIPPALLTSILPNLQNTTSPQNPNTSTRHSESTNSTVKSSTKTPSSTFLQTQNTTSSPKSTTKLRTTSPQMNNTTNSPMNTTSLQTQNATASPKSTTKLSTTSLWTQNATASPKSTTKLSTTSLQTQNGTSSRKSTTKSSTTSLQTQNGTSSPKSTTKSSTTSLQTKNSTASPKSTTKPTTTHQPKTEKTTSFPDTTNAPPILDSESHIYYTSTVLQDKNYWDELHNHTKLDALKDSHRSTRGLPVSFSMPFYGHTINKIQITTGGFLYMHPWVHRFLTHSQYVAPLMANFDTYGSDAEILYKAYENESIVIEWRNVQLNDQRHHGSFTFQTKLFQNGTIMLLYKTIPVWIAEISSENHPIKVGVSDAFHWDYVQNGVNYRRIVKYHALEINTTYVKDDIVIILDPLPTCNLATDCNKCVTQKINFTCSWCSDISWCSDGLDWNYQTWRDQECPEKAVNNTDSCIVTTTRKTTLMTTTSTPLVAHSSTTSRPTIQTPSSTTSSTMRVTTITSTTKLPTVPTATTKNQTSTTKPTTSIPTTTAAKPATTTTKPTTTTTKLTTMTTKPTTTSTTAQTTKSTIATKPTTASTSSIPTTSQKPATEGANVDRLSQKNKPTTNKAAIIAPVVLLTFLVVLIGTFMYYAYTHPNSRSGQWLIEHRPSQLRAKFSNMFKWSSETGEKYRVKNEDIEFDMEESTA